MNVGTSMLLY